MGRAAALFGLLTACTTAGSAVVPASPRASDALSERCSETDYARPYVVDWAGVDRADLREVEERGVIVLKHDCDVLRVLTDCKLPGKYGFVGMSAEETLVALETAGEVRANLPISGVKLAAELSQDSALVLALVHAGKAVAQLEPDAVLSGACEGATHYVRGVYRGAFAMETSARGAARTAAQVLGLGATADAHGARRFRIAAGDPSACHGAHADSTSAPPGCDVPLRLELRVLNAAQPAPAKVSAEATDFVGCPDNFVERQGRCVPQSDGQPYACTPSDLPECNAQCQRGSAVSCAREAFLLHHGLRGVAKDLETARVLYERACNAGVQHGCSGLGVFLKRGLGGVSQDLARAFELQRAACEAGEVRGCNSLAVFYDEGKVVAEDAAHAFKLYDRACQGGLPIACTNLGTLVLDGRGAAQSDAGAVQLYQRGCLQGSAEGCDRLRDLALVGRTSGAPIASLREVYDRDCKLGSAAACASLAQLDGLAAAQPAQ